MHATHQKLSIDRLVRSAACCFGFICAFAAANVEAAAPNVHLVSGQVHTSQQVEGDLMAAGGRVSVDHAVNGDANLAGGSVEVRAAVGDDLRVAAGSVMLSSTVGGEALLSAGSVTLTPTAAVAQGTRLYGGSVTVGGSLAGPLAVSAQTIYLNGEVKGDARLVAEKIELGPLARLGGALSYSSPTEILKAPGAVVLGAVTRETRSTGRYGRSSDSSDSSDAAERPGHGQMDRESSMSMHASGPGWLGGVFAFLALLAFGAVALLICPVFMPRAANTVKTSPGLSLAAGLGVVIAVPVLAVLLFATLLGIPLGFAVMALYPALGLTGFVVGVLAFSMWLRALLRRSEFNTYASTLLWFALTLALLMLLAWLPFIGGLLGLSVMLIGLGGGALEWYRRRQTPTPASGAIKQA